MADGCGGVQGQNQGRPDHIGGWVHVDLAVDKSKYGMPIPEDLQDMLDDDLNFETI